MDPHARLMNYPGLEWHAFIASRDRRTRIVGRVEGVDRDQIWLSRMDTPAGYDAVEVSVSWDDVGCIAVCGPDRDADLFALLHDSPGD